MRPVLFRTLFASVLGGCVRTGFDDTPIVAAGLERFDLSALDLIVGFVDGDATLLFTQANGVSGEVPVHLGGGSLGVVLDLSADFEGHDGVVPIDLSDVKDPTLGDVFGTYNGSAATVALLIGQSQRRMRHASGASLREDHFVFGLSLFAGYQWIVIRPGGEEGNTTGFPIDTFAPEPGPTGDTADTGVPLPDDTGAGPGSSGCEGATGSTSGTGSGSDCGCDGDGSDCSCSHTGLVPPGAVAFGLLLRRRTRLRGRSGSPS